MDIGDVLAFSLAQRQAMYMYRRDYIRLSRNGIEVMLYAMTQGSFTSYEVSKHFLHTNIHQTLVVLNQLVKHNILYKLGKGVKGSPAIFLLTEIGCLAVNDYLKMFKKNIQAI